MVEYGLVANGPHPRDIELDSDSTYREGSPFDSGLSHAIVAVVFFFFLMVKSICNPKIRRRMYNRGGPNEERTKMEPNQSIWAAGTWNTPRRPFDSWLGHQSDNVLQHGQRLVADGPPRRNHVRPLDSPFDPGLGYGLGDRCSLFMPQTTLPCNPSNRYRIRWRRLGSGRFAPTKSKATVTTGVLLGAPVRFGTGPCVRCSPFFLWFINGFERRLIYNKRCDSNMCKAR